MSYISDTKLEEIVVGQKLACDECGKSFPWPSQLESHKRVHSGHKPYVCQFCQKSFTQKGHMRRHEFTIHSYTGIA